MTDLPDNLSDACNSDEVREIWSRMGGTRGGTSRYYYITCWRPEIVLS